MLKQICKIVCTIQVLTETIRVAQKSDSTLLLCSPLRSPRVSHCLAFGVTIDKANDKFLQISDDFVYEEALKLLSACRTQLPVIHEVITDL